MEQFGGCEFTILNVNFMKLKCSSGIPTENLAPKMRYAASVKWVLILHRPGMIK